MVVNGLRFESLTGQLKGRSGKPRIVFHNLRPAKLKPRFLGESARQFLHKSLKLKLFFPGQADVTVLFQ